MHAYVKELDLNSEEPAETHAPKYTHTLRNTHTKEELTHTHTHSETHTHTHKHTHVCTYSKRLLADNQISTISRLLKIICLFCKRAL